MNKEKTKLEKFLSFTIDENELRNQIQNYNTLKINKSYRGISALIIFTICAISILGAFLMRDQIESMNSAFIGIAIYTTTGFCIYKGRKSAIIFAMLLWTSDKAMFIFQSGGSGAFVVFFFWILVMRFFWRALEVENFRKDLANLEKEKMHNHS